MRFEGIQILRFLAAEAVVVSHVGLTFNMAHAPNLILAHVPHLGTLGVIAFFGISGFVMGILQHRGQNWKLFALGRLIRIVPIYWAATGVWALYTYLVLRTFDPTWLVTSLTFTSQIISHKLPYLYLGWSLEFEMLFYLAVAASILIFKGFRTRVLSTTALFMVVSFLGGGAQLFVYFAIGQLVALARLEFFQAERVEKLQLATKWLWIVFLASVPIFELSTGDSYVKALIVLVLVMVAAVTNAQSRASKLLVALGDSSYALYLTHPFALVLLGWTIPKIGDAQPGIWIASALAIVLATIVAIQLHHRLESPVNSFLRGRLL